jgi:hypothetical protein
VLLLRAIKRQARDGEPERAGGVLMSGREPVGARG